MTRRSRATPSALTVTDQFCGAGGSSLGAVNAGAEVRLAMNHWARAIETHNTNFPATAHECTDISACDPRRYPSTDVLITSPECTNHSLAKGQKKQTNQFDMLDAATIDPAAERSRATMWDVPRFAEYHQYRAIIVENVVDARSWVLWPAWWHAMECLGYVGKCVYVNSMHAHPTPQSRDRMYVVWWKKGNRAPDLEMRPNAWCPRCATDIRAVQSWKRPDKPWGKYRTQYLYCCPTCGIAVEPYYYAALNALDLALPAKRIGDRERPLAPRTMARIAYGLEKYGRQPIYIHCSQGGGGRDHEMAGRVRGAAVEPSLAQTGSAHYGVATPWIVDTLRTDEGAARAFSVAEPMHTQTTRREYGVAMPAFLASTNYFDDRCVHPSKPAPTITTAPGKWGLVQGAKLMTLRAQEGGFLHSSLSDPTFTQVGATQAALVQRAPYLAKYYGTALTSHSSEAMPTMPAIEKMGLVEMPGTSQEVDDLYFRMLATHEIQATMAFPAPYVVTGTKREQVKQLGNAVTPPVMQLLLWRVLASLAPELYSDPRAEMVA